MVFFFVADCQRVNIFRHELNRRNATTLVLVKNTKACILLPDVPDAEREIRAAGSKNISVHLEHVYSDNFVFVAKHSCNRSRLVVLPKVDCGVITTGDEVVCI